MDEKPQHLSLMRFSLRALNVLPPQVAGMLDSDPSHIHRLAIDRYRPGTINEAWLHIINNGIGEPVRLPVLIARVLATGRCLA